MRAPTGVAEVAAAAGACGTWSEVVAGSRSCTACADLAAGRSTVVVGDAPPGARLALVGEAPGAEEDRMGRPFVGKAGRLLDDLLAEAGLRRDEVAVLNVLQCRPPGNRAPRAAEVARCRSWLSRKLDLIDPRLVCALGLTAASWFLGRGVRLGAARGVVHRVDGRSVVVSYHPSAAIRFGPTGMPIGALRADLARVAALLEQG